MVSEASVGPVQPVVWQWYTALVANCRVHLAVLCQGAKRKIFSLHLQHVGEASWRMDIGKLHCWQHASRPQQVPVPPPVKADRTTLRRSCQAQAQRGAAQHLPASSASRLIPRSDIAPPTPTLPELAQHIHNWQATSKPRPWLSAWAAEAATALPNASPQALLHFLQVLAALPPSTMQALEPYPRLWTAIWRAMARCFSQPLQLQSSITTTNSHCVQASSSGDDQQGSRGRVMAGVLQQDAGYVPVDMVVQALKVMGRVRKRAGLCPRDDLILTLARQVIMHLTMAVPTAASSASADAPAQLGAVPVSHSPTSRSGTSTARAAGAAAVTGPNLRSQENSRQYTSQLEFSHMSGRLLVPLLQALHQLACPLPPQDAVALAKVIKSHLPYMRRMHVSKLLAALPHLEVSLPPEMAVHLRGVLLQTMLDLLHTAAGMKAAPMGHAQHASTATSGVGRSAEQVRGAMQVQAMDVRADSQEQTQQPAAALQTDHSRAAVHSSGHELDDVHEYGDGLDECGMPLEAWELSNWLYALSRWPSSTQQPSNTWRPDSSGSSSSSGSNSNSSSNNGSSGASVPGLAYPPQAAQHPHDMDTTFHTAAPSNRVVDQLLLPMLMEVASHQLLRQASAVDLVAIVDGFARLKARPPPDWLQQLSSVADCRCLARLQPHQLVAFTRSCAQLGIGTVMTDAWAAKLHSLTHGTMNCLTPVQLSQLAWSTAALHQQAFYQHQQAAAQQQLQFNAEPAQEQPTVVTQWDDHDTVPTLPADWVLHWMDASQGAFRQSDCGTLAAFGKALASLIQLGHEQQLTLTGRVNAGADAQEAAGWRLAQQQLIVWCELWCGSARQRVHTADGRGLTMLSQACAQLQAQLQQLPSSGTASDDVSLGGIRNGNNSSNSSNSSSSGSSSNGSSRGSNASRNQHCIEDVQCACSRLCEVALAALQQLHGAVERCAGPRSMQDLADTLTAVARMNGCMRTELLSRHLQLTSCLAAQHRPSEQVARDLSATLLAVTSVHSLDSTGIIAVGGHLDWSIQHAPTTWNTAAAAAAARTEARATEGGALVEGSSGVQLAPTVAASAAAPAMVGDTPQGKGPVCIEGPPHALLTDHIHALLRQLARHLPAASAGAVAASCLAIARLRLMPDAELMGALLLACHRRMSAMRESYLNQMIWALGQLRVCPADKWLQQLQVVMFRRLQEGGQQGLSLQTRATVLWSAARGDWTLHRRFIIAMVPDAADLAGLPVSDLVMMGWALAKLRLRPPPAWIVVLLMASGSETARACMAMPETSVNPSTREMAPSTSILTQDAADRSHPADTVASSDITLPRPSSAAHTEAVNTNMHTFEQQQQQQQEGVDAAMQQRCVQLAVPLVMLADSLGAWQVTAPYWWWCAWVSAMHAAVPAMGLYTASEVWRALGKRSYTLLQLSAAYPTLADALCQLQQHLLKHSLQLLQQQQADGAAPSCAALASMASGLARVAERHAKAGLPDSVSIAAASELAALLERLLHVTQPRLSHAQPQYLLMMASAVVKLQALHPSPPPSAALATDTGLMATGIALEVGSVTTEGRTRQGARQKMQRRVRNIEAPTAGTAQATAHAGKSCNTNQQDTMELEPVSATLERGRLACDTEASSAQQLAQGRTATTGLIDPWRREVAAVLAARWSTLDTASKVHARQVVRGLYGAGPGDVLPTGATHSPLWE